jgi:hypothetical protein
MDIPLECVLVGQWQGIQGLNEKTAVQIRSKADWKPEEMPDNLQPQYRGAVTQLFKVHEGTSKTSDFDFSLPPSTEWPVNKSRLSDQPFYFRIQPATEVHRKLFPKLTLKTKDFFMKSDTWMTGDPHVYKNGKWVNRNQGESSRDGEGGGAE